MRSNAACCWRQAHCIFIEGAGALARAAVAVPAGAAEESRPELAPAARRLIGDLLAGRRPMTVLPAGASSSAQPTATELRSLLPEAFSLVGAAGRRLPHCLLATALDARHPRPHSPSCPFWASVGVGLPHGMRHGHGLGKRLRPKTRASTPSRRGRREDSNNGWQCSPNYARPHPKRRERGSLRVGRARRQRCAWPFSIPWRPI